MPENKKKTRGNLAVMGRLVGLVKPLTPVMVAAVLLGVAGFLCAIFITVLGAYALLDSILPGMPISLGTVCLLLPVLAIARGVLHYAEQGCNHFIAFKLLALIRDKVFGALNGFVLDSLRGVQESLQYGDGPHRLAQINARTDELSSQERRLKLAGGTAQAVTGGIILLLDAGMLALAAGLAQSGTIGFDGCLIAVVALMSSFGPVIALANLGTGLQNTFAAGNRVLDVLDEQPTVREVTGGEDIAFTGAACRRVTFGYGSDVILNDVSLEVPQNSVIGITGRSGSGKSTLLKLMMRFWDTDLGKVELSGVNIKKINTASLRSAESFVEQDTVLFHDSIEENLRIANQNATHEQVVGACKKASIHDFIMTLPQGYDTPVGELGSTLSGGERQRLGVARAFLHDAPYILLDEPTSNLDSLNEAVILKSLAEERKDKTVVLVSHRASTMRIADRTYSVENGRMS